MVNQYADSLYKVINSIANDATQDLATKLPEYFVCKIIEAPEGDESGLVAQTLGENDNQIFKCQAITGYRLGDIVIVQKNGTEFNIVGFAESPIEAQEFFNFYYENNLKVYDYTQSSTSRANNDLLTAQLHGNGDMIWFSVAVASGAASKDRIDTASLAVKIKNETENLIIAEKVITADTVEGDPYDIDTILKYKFKLPKDKLNTTDNYSIEIVNNSNYEHDQLQSFYFSNITAYVGNSKNERFTYEIGYKLAIAEENSTIFSTDYSSLILNYADLINSRYKVKAIFDLNGVNVGDSLTTSIYTINGEELVCEAGQNYILFNINTYRSQNLAYLKANANLQFGFENWTLQAQLPIIIENYPQLQLIKTPTGNALNANLLIEGTAVEDPTYQPWNAANEDTGGEGAGLPRVQYNWKIQDVQYVNNITNQFTPTIVGQSSEDPLSPTGAIVSGHETWAEGEVVTYTSSGQTLEYICILDNSALSWRTLGSTGTYLDLANWTCAAYVNNDNTAKKYFIGQAFLQQGPKGDPGKSIIIKDSQEECTEIGDAYIDENGHLQTIVAIDYTEVPPVITWVDGGLIRQPPTTEYTLIGVPRALYKDATGNFIENSKRFTIEVKKAVGDTISTFVGDGVSYRMNFLLYESLSGNLNEKSSYQRIFSLNESSLEILLYEASGVWYFIVQNENTNLTNVDVIKCQFEQNLGDNEEPLWTVLDFAFIDLKQEYAFPDFIINWSGKRTTIGNDYIISTQGGFGGYQNGAFTGILLGDNINQSSFNTFNGIIGFSENQKTFCLNALTGKLEAISGTIGNWNLENNRLYSINNAVTPAVSYGLDSNSYNEETEEKYKYAFWAGGHGDLNSSVPMGETALFSVTKDGYLKAESGKVGGWELGKDILKSGENQSFVGLSSSGDYAFWAGAQNGQSAPFSVTPQGELTAKNILAANFNGLEFRSTHTAFENLEKINLLVVYSAPSNSSGPITMSMYFSSSIFYGQENPIGILLEWKKVNESNKHVIKFDSGDKYYEYVFSSSIVSSLSSNDVSIKLSLFYNDIVFDTQEFSLKTKKTALGWDNNLNRYQYVEHREFFNGDYTLIFGNLLPGATSQYTIGKETLRWKEAYCDDVYTATSTSSDRTKKHDIKDLSLKYLDLFDKLIPKTFKYNNGSSNRTHTGFIAQEVEAAMQESDLTSLDFAGLVIDNKDTLRETYYLRYNEFIPLCVAKIQQQAQQISVLQTELTEIKNLLQQKGETE